MGFFKKCDLLGANEISEMLLNESSVYRTFFELEPGTHHMPCLSETLNTLTHKLMVSINLGDLVRFWRFGVRMKKKKKRKKSKCRIYLLTVI